MNKVEKQELIKSILIIAGIVAIVITVIKAFV